MQTAEKTIAIYQELADWHDRRGEPQLRDRFLVLAADTAQASGNARQAEQMCQVLLQLNPAHMFKPYGTFAGALRSPDVQIYLADLRKSYPPDGADELLQSLRAEQGNGKAPTALLAQGPPSPSSAKPLAMKGNDPSHVYQLKDDRPSIGGPPSAKRAPGFAPVAIPIAGPALRVGQSVVAGSTPSAYRPEPEPLMRSGAKRERARESYRERVAGNWLASVLGMLVLTTGLILAYKTLVQPLLH